MTTTRFRSSYLKHATPASGRLPQIGWDGHLSRGGQLRGSTWYSKPEPVLSVHLGPPPRSRLPPVCDRGCVITENAALALSLVLRDFVGTPMENADAQLIDLDPAHLELVADRLPDSAGWVDQTAPTAHRLLFRASGGIRSLDCLPDATGALAAEMASVLQDDVMDELFRPWPEVMVGGRSAVLEPRVGADGTAEWAEHGRSFCPVGRLHEHL